MDVYDEVDRRETDAGWVEKRLNAKRCQSLSCSVLKCHPQCGSQLRTTARWWQRLRWCLSFRSILSIHQRGTRHVNSQRKTILDARLSDRPRTDFFFLVSQGRQKLARFNAHEFATLVIDILSDAKRRQQGNSIGSPKGQRLWWKLPYVCVFFKSDSWCYNVPIIPPILNQTTWISCWKVSPTARRTTMTACRLMRTQIKTFPPAKATGPR